MVSDGDREAVLFVYGDGPNGRWSSRKSFREDLVRALSELRDLAFALDILCCCLYPYVMNISTTICTTR